MDLLSAGPHGPGASCIIGYKGTQDVFLLSEGFVVVPLKFTSTRLFNWESAFAEVSTQSWTGKVGKCYGWKNNFVVQGAVASQCLLLEQWQLMWCWSAARWQSLVHLAFQWQVQSDPGVLPVQPASAVSSDEPLMTEEAEPFRHGAISQITVIRLLRLKVTAEPRHVHIKVLPSFSADVCAVFFPLEVLVLQECCLSLWIVAMERCIPMRQVIKLKETLGL